MKTLLLVCACALLAGCAHRDQGRPQNLKGFETGTHSETEPPRKAMEPPPTGSDYLRRDGPGGSSGPQR